LGRPQTDADRARVLDGLAAARGVNSAPGVDLATTLRNLAPRWFLTRNVHAASPPVLLNPRHTLSWMRGPMTRVEIRRARGVVDGLERASGAASAPMGPSSSAEHQNEVA
jgi:hypothetical protein